MYATEVPMVMQTGWTEEIQIPPRTGCEKEAMERASSFAAAIGFQGERIEDIKTVVSEACLNAIEHTRREGLRDTILVRFLRDETGMKIMIVNKGKPFTPVEGRPDIREKIEGKDRPRGWGTFLMLELSDGVEITHDRGETTVTISVRL